MVFVFLYSSCEIMGEMKELGSPYSWLLS